MDRFFLVVYFEPRYAKILIFVITFLEISFENYLRIYTSSTAIHDVDPTTRGFASKGNVESRVS